MTNDILSEFDITDSLSVNTERGLELVPLWKLMKDLPEYGLCCLRLSKDATSYTLSQLARALIEQGYVMICGQQVPVFPMRSTEGALFGIEVRIGRNPPQFKTIKDPENE